MFGHEPGQGSFQCLTVDWCSQGADRQDGLPNHLGIARLQTDHDVADACLFERVEPPGRTEVDQAESAVAQEEHIPRVGIGVETIAVEHRLDGRCHDRLCQLVGVDPALADAIELRDGNAIEPLHHHDA